MHPEEVGEVGVVLVDREHGVRLVVVALAQHPHDEVQMLIAASTTFMATIGQTPTRALNTTRMTQATVLSTRSRRIRACSSE